MLHGDTENMEHLIIYFRIQVKLFITKNIAITDGNNLNSERYETIREGDLVSARALLIAQTVAT